MHVEVECKGEVAEGATIADKRRLKPELRKKPNVNVCVQVDASGFLSFFWERLLCPRL